MVSPVTIKIFSYKGTTIRDLGGKNQKSNLVVFIIQTEKCNKNLAVSELKAQLKQICTIISNFNSKNLNQIKTLQFNVLFSFSTFFMYENNLEGVKETGKKTINQRLILSLKKKQNNQSLVRKSILSDHCCYQSKLAITIRSW